MVAPVGCHSHSSDPIGWSVYPFLRRTERRAVTCFVSVFVGCIVTGGDQPEVGLRRFLLGSACREGMDRIPVMFPSALSRYARRSVIPPEADANHRGWGICRRDCTPSCIGRETRGDNLRAHGGTWDRRGSIGGAVGPSQVPRQGQSPDAEED